MIWKIIICFLSLFSGAWFGRLTYIASQNSGTGYLGEFIIYVAITLICALTAIIFRAWAGWTWLKWFLG